MNSGIRVGRIFGVDVLLHPSLLIFVALMTLSWGGSVYPDVYGLDRATSWKAGIATAILVALSILAHEVAHMLAAKAQGIPVHSIVLYLFGGLANIERNAASPLREAFMAGIGPLTNLAIGLGLQEAALLMTGPRSVRLVIYLVGQMNMMLAIINAVPGLPLDGGRVLHALFWAVGGDFVAASRRTVSASSVLGGLAIAVGLWSLRSARLGGALSFGTIGKISLGGIDGIWLAFIGVIMLSAASASRRQAQMPAFEQAPDLPPAHVQTPAQPSSPPPPPGATPSSDTVAAVMTVVGAWIPPNITLATAHERYFSDRSLPSLPVEGAPGELDGVLSIADLMRTPPSAWATVRVRDVMTPRQHVVSIGPDESAAEAWGHMARLELDYMAVTKNGRLLGFVRRGLTPRDLRPS